jgi:uncharacterized cofD-like protein
MSSKTAQIEMNFLKWFYPGMGIKRWIILCIVGLSFLVVVALSAIKSISGISIFLASVSMALLIFGIFLVIIGIRNIIKTFVETLAPQTEGDLVEAVYQKRQERALERAPRVVVIGGGTGLSTMLSGVKKYTKNITAIVTVTDTGGSSGRLRDELDMLPPGDIRNCLVALADSEQLISDLFQYRFEDGSGLKGHSFGNLFIAALSKITGNFDQAIKESSRVLVIRGRVIPSTLDKVGLRADFEDGTTAEGEVAIVDMRKPISELSLYPRGCEPTQEALDAIENADLIILGPGSLYTSVLPNLLIPKIAEKIKASPAYKLYVSNVMTQPGETDGFSVSRHLEVLREHTHPGIVDGCIANTAPIPQELVEKYAGSRSEPVKLDTERLQEQGTGVFTGEVVKLDGQVRHDADKLASLIFETYELESKLNGK